MNEELVDIIAEELFGNLLEAGYIKLVPEVKGYSNLPHSMKETFRHMAHNIIASFDDYYDCEAEEDEEIDDEEDPFEENSDFDWILDR
jgi:hypothetical protein